MQLCITIQSVYSYITTVTVYSFTSHVVHNIIIALAFNFLVIVTTIPYVLRIISHSNDNIVSISITLKVRR